MKILVIKKLIGLKIKFRIIFYLRTKSIRRRPVKVALKLKLNLFSVFHSFRLHHYITLGRVRIASWQVCSWLKNKTVHTRQVFVLPRPWNTAVSTSPAPPQRRISRHYILPFFKFHNRIVLSLLPDTIYFPSQEIETQFTDKVCPYKTYNC